MDLHRALSTLWLLLLLDLVSLISAQFASDSCEETIWDSTAEAPGVHHVFLHCAQGRLTWRYPYGAVRLTLQIGGGSSPFEACFIAQSFSTFAKISIETTAPDDGAQVLEPLTFLDVHNPRTLREMCVTSATGDAVTLYLESETDQESRTIGQVELEYDLQRKYQRPTVSNDDSMEDCRPCTDQELLYAVCTSDFAVTGSIGAVFHNQQVGETEVQLQVSKILHQEHLLFKRSASLSAHSPLTHLPLARGQRKRRRRNVGNVTHLHNKAGDINSEGVRAVPEKDPGGTVIAPHKCGIRESRDGSQDQFLFVGKIRLQRARLQCAPRVEDFEEIWDQAMREGTNPCILE